MATTGGDPIRALDRADCLRLLSHSQVGRLALTMDALPVVQPVRYALCEDLVVFPARRGSRLESATLGAVVAFQTDCFDTAADDGWSVLVTGIAQPVDAPARCAQAELMLGPQVHEDNRLVGLPTEVITGQRFGEHLTAPR